jgi:hypothetical protein
MSTSVPASSMLILPSYAPLQAEFVDAMRNMASAPDGPATEQGEYFLMALAERRAVSTLQDGDYIIVPLLTLVQLRLYLIHRAANSLVGGRRPTIIDVKKLIPVKRTAGKGIKRAAATAAEKPIASKQARKGAAKPTRPSVVVGRGSRDPESIWSAPELELVRSKGRRVSEDQL